MEEQEVLKMLNELMGEIKKTRTDLSSEISQTRADLSTEISLTRADLLGEISTIKSEVDSNRILLEEVQKQIKTVAEGVTSLREQTAQQFETLTHYVNEKTSILEKVIRNDVDEAKHIKGILGEHEVSIRHLKSKSL
ncbi:hypothetical protein [Desulfosporosinus meridiei]|uniref:Uncharacterized protein n=1 Tax=Desulfosporosinus meridiei (strain ATCC BAA-275 / DSM 13257 / KCTC 12902 / NCIMB 13706 / S10) TaxID=768704 RepID=J7IV13_DESMD|nr:hypothetical protein [Desulfosporosinus meridiei]AFQ43989.1 hypothetical protein Desmer_2046 [Desulfosporosinus meridiei DSM 13257]